MSAKQWTTVALVGLIAASGAPAQNPALRKVYTNRLLFSLPVRIEDRDKAELKELKFYVKAILGGRPGEWQCVETALPTKDRFQFQAAQDGEYWFAFVTVDRLGRVSPTDLDRQSPGLMVVVDTKAPDVEVQKMTLATGETLLQCQIRDANPDFSKLKLEALLPDKSVRLLEPVEDSPGVFRIGDASVLKGLVRATTVDKAGNRAVRDVDLAPPSPAAPIAKAVTTPRQPATPTVLPASASVVRPAERIEHAVAAAPALPSAGKHFVNSLRVSLDYALDSPNVARVEGFATRDGGRSWMRIGEDLDRRSPLEFELPEDGVYGISLVVSTPTSPRAMPAAGDTPDCWIEVDLTKPLVQVSDVRLG